MNYLKFIYFTKCWIFSLPEQRTVAFETLNGSFTDASQFFSERKVFKNFLKCPASLAAAANPTFSWTNFFFRWPSTPSYPYHLKMDSNPNWKMSNQIWVQCSVQNLFTFVHLLKSVFELLKCYGERASFQYPVYPNVLYVICFVSP